MDLAKSSLKLFLGNLGSATVGFIGIAYFARTAGPSRLGLFFLFQALLGMLAIPADFGLRGAVEKRISEGDSPGVILSTSVISKFVLLVSISAIIYFLRSPIAAYLEADIAPLLILAIVLQEIGRLSQAVLRGELRVGETALLRLSVQVTWVGAGAWFIANGFLETGLIYGYLLGLGVMGVWGWQKVSVSPETPSIETMRSLVDYGRHNFISSIGGYFYNWMDVAIIGLFLSQAHVAAYEVAWRVCSVVILFSRSIATTIFPQVSEWSAAGSKDRIEELIPQVITPSVILVIPAFFGTMIISEELLSLVFGTEYIMAGAALIVLMFDQVTEAFQIVLGRALQGIDRPDMAAKATVVSVILNLILNVILIQWYGISGAAFATMIASLIGGLIMHAYYLNRLIDVRIRYRELRGCIVSAIVMWGILYGATTYVQITTVARLIALILLGIVVYGLSLGFIPSTRTLITNHTQSTLRGIIE